MERSEKWDFGREMTLPDWCFGRRYWTGNYVRHGAGGMNYALAEEELPDKFVVWGVLFSNISAGCTGALSLSIRLAKSIPVAGAEYLALERLFKVVKVTTGVYETFLEPNGTVFIQTERQIIESAGRRFLIRVIGDGVHSYDMSYGVQISALSKEVPAWLVSGRVKSLL